MLGLPFSTPKRLVKKHESSQNDLEWWWMAGKGRCNHRVITDARTSMGPSRLAEGFHGFFVKIPQKKEVESMIARGNAMYAYYQHPWSEGSNCGSKFEACDKSGGVVLVPTPPVPARKGWQSKPQPPKGPTFFLSARKRSCANASSMSCHSFKSWFCKRCCLFGEWCVMIWPG